MNARGHHVAARILLRHITNDSAHGRTRSWVLAGYCTRGERLSCDTVVTPSDRHDGSAARSADPLPGRSVMTSPPTTPRGR